jgi:redox-sensitive bicupin YhaK (pirin superfamily)
MLDHVLEDRRRDLGGFEVARVLPAVGHRQVGPFVFFDHLGPVDFAPGFARTADVRPHPHIGLSTVTYLFDGEITHRDSVGSEQAIRPGEVNWMVAGSGITHSERFERLRRDGGRIDAIQAWVALPEEDEECAPAFIHHGDADMPKFDEKGAAGRLIAGTAYGLRAEVETHSPMFYVHCVLRQNAVVPMPDDHRERAAYVVSGAVELGGQVYPAGRMLVFTPGAAVALKASSDSVVMLLGGASLGPRYLEWNFVSSSRDRIEQAKADWRAGRMKLPDLDSGEFIPLPPDPPGTRIIG